MADALCGPSNPLQNFQKHTTVDRSLQHDRLASRQGNAQGFRSTTNGNVGVLDPEFEAFEAGAQLGFPEPRPDGLHNPFEQRQPLSQPYQNLSHFQPQPPGWASDFQQLHAPSAFVSPLHQASTHGDARGSWHDEFKSQQQTRVPFAHSRLRPTAAFTSFSHGHVQRPCGYVPSQPCLDQSAEARWKGKGRWTDPTQDNAAFEREFEALSTEEPQQGTAQVVEEQSTELGQDVQMSNHLQASQVDVPTANLVYQENIDSNDFIEEERSFLHSSKPPLETRSVDKDEPQTHQPPETDEEMRATARKVVDHIQDETSDKFKNSEFFALMRQIRDGEKQVKEDKIVDVEVRSGSILPPAQQDADLGSDYQMAGALSPTVIEVDAGKGTGDLGVFRIEGSEGKPRPFPFIPPP